MDWNQDEFLTCWYSPSPEVVWALLHPSRILIFWSQSRYQLVSTVKTDFKIVEIENPGQDQVKNWDKLRLKGKYLSRFSFWNCRDFIGYQDTLFGTVEIETLDLDMSRQIKFSMLSIFAIVRLNFFKEKKRLRKLVWTRLSIT
jgi:hypothetical protein